MDTELYAKKVKAEYDYIKAEHEYMKHIKQVKQPLFFEEIKKCTVNTYDPNYKNYFNKVKDDNDLVSLYIEYEEYKKNILRPILHLILMIIENILVIQI